MRRRADTNNLTLGEQAGLRLAKRMCLAPITLGITSGIGAIQHANNPTLSLCLSFGGLVTLVTLNRLGKRKVWTASYLALKQPLIERSKHE